MPAVSSEQLGQVTDGVQKQSSPRLKRPASPISYSGPPQKKFKCDPCDQGFTTKRALLRHTREDSTHCATANIARASFECRECFQTFARASGLARHYREQHGQGKGPCSRCGKAVRSSAPHKNPEGESCVAKLFDIPEDACEDKVVKLDDPSQDSSQNIEGLVDVDDQLCQGMCFMGLASSEQMQADGSDSPQLAVKEKVPPSVLKKEVRLATSRSMICGICQQNFELYSESALFGHLKAHLEDLSDAQHVCNVCQIAFVHRKDFERHMQSAAEGDCGSSFAHKSFCNGHHDPCPESWLISAGEERSPILHDCHAEDDRNRFHRQLREWEMAQLRLYSHSVNALAEEALPRASCFSENYAYSKASSVAPSCSRSEGARLQHRTRKRWLPRMRWGKVEETVSEEGEASTSPDSIKPSLEEAIYLLESGSALKEDGSYDPTALQVVAHHAESELVVEHLKQGASSLASCTLEESPLACTVQNGLQSTVKLLGDLYRTTRLFEHLGKAACMHNDTKELALILSVFAVVCGHDRYAVDVFHGNIRQCSLLVPAQEHGNLECALLLLDRGASFPECRASSPEQILEHGLASLIRDTLLRSDNSCSSGSKMRSLEMLFEWARSHSLGGFYHTTTLREANTTSTPFLFERVFEMSLKQNAGRESHFLQDAILDSCYNCDPGLLLRLVEEGLHADLSLEGLVLDGLAAEAVISCAPPRPADLLRRCLPPESQAVRNQHSLLCRAITSAADDTFSFLLLWGADVKAICPTDGKSALQVAREQTRPWLMETLRSYGAVDDEAAGSDDFAERRRYCQDITKVVEVNVQIEQDLD